MNTKQHSLYRFVPKSFYKMANKWKDFSPHTIAIMLKTAFAFLSLILFMRLTMEVQSNGPLQLFDDSVLRWVESLRTPFMNIMILDITALGGLALNFILGILAIVIFLLARDPAAAIHLTLTTAGGFGISILMKNIIVRPRPTIIPQLIHASGFSYPSGHSITSAAVYLTMAILACRHFKSYQARLILLTLSGVMIALISFSRIYLGVHYPTDTLSGALIGISWALIMAALFSKTHFSKR